MAPSSSGLGHLVFIQKIPGSNPGGVTRNDEYCISMIFIVQKMKEVLILDLIQIKDQINRQFSYRGLSLPSTEEVAEVIKLLPYPLETVTGSQIKSVMKSYLEIKRQTE